MDISKKTLIILPHLDDEFALVPLIKKIARNNSIDLKIVYCAERTLDSENKRKNCVVFVHIHFEEKKK